MLKRYEELDYCDGHYAVYDQTFNYGVRSEEEPTEAEMRALIDEIGDQDYPYYAVECEELSEGVWHVTALYPLQLEDLDDNQFAMLQQFQDSIKATHVNSKIDEVFIGYCKTIGLKECKELKISDWKEMFSSFLIKSAENNGTKYIAVANDFHYTQRRSILANKRQAS